MPAAVTTSPERQASARRRLQALRERGVTLHQLGGALNLSHVMVHLMTTGERRISERVADVLERLEPDGG